MEDLNELRDRIAMAALQGMLAADGNVGPRWVARDPLEQHGGGKWLEPLGVSCQAYAIADAMLQARELKPATSKLAAVARMVLNEYDEEDDTCSDEVRAFAKAARVALSVA